MRTHAEIVKGYGASALRRALADRGVSLSAWTAQRWADRGSIPPRYWTDLAELGVAQISELAAGVERANGQEPVAEGPELQHVSERARTFDREQRPVQSEESGLAVRRAALEAFLALAHDWRSEEPYGSREELHER